MGPTFVALMSAPVFSMVHGLVWVLSQLWMCYSPSSDNSASTVGMLLLLTAGSCLAGINRCKQTDVIGSAVQLVGSESHNSRIELTAGAVLLGLQ